MSQKNDTLALVITLLISLGLFGVAGWWLWRNFGGNSRPGQTSTVTTTGNLADRFSEGERVLLGGEGATAKREAARAIADRQYEKAVTILRAHLDRQKNDPEAAIYLENAKIGGGKSYTLAVVVPSSSDPDGTGEILRGVAQAQRAVNASGGIKGIPLKILIANDDDDPEVAKQVARRLADNPEVLGVIGHWSSGVTLAAAPTYEQARLVAISPVSTSVKLSNAGDYIFRTVPSDRFAGSALSRYAVERAKKRRAAVFFNSQSNYSQSLKDEFTTAFYADGGEVVAEIDLSQPHFNAAEAYKAVTGKGADVLMLAVTTDTFDRMLQILQVNDGRLDTIAGDDAYTSKLLQIGGKDAVDTVVAIPWHILADPGAAFSRKARELWGGDVSWRTATSYDATEALLGALAVSPTREGIRSALAAADFSAPGASGPVRFLPSGDRDRSVQLVKVVPGKRSGYGFDFVPWR